jgi:hypothetical protein
MTATNNNVLPAASKPNRQSSSEPSKKALSIAGLVGVAILGAGVTIGYNVALQGGTEARAAAAQRADGYRKCADYVASLASRDVALEKLASSTRTDCGVDYTLGQDNYTSKGSLRTYKYGDGLDGGITMLVVEAHDSSAKVSNTVIGPTNVTLPTPGSLVNTANGLEAWSRTTDMTSEGLGGAGLGALAAIAVIGTAGRFGLLFSV